MTTKKVIFNLSTSMTPPKKKKPEQEIASEWDLSQGMGILPDDLSLTQNIGCVGGKPAKAEKPIKNQSQKE